VFTVFYILNINTITLKEDITVTIPEGSGAKVIAETLAQNRVIKNAPAFVYYIKKQNAATDLRPGTYIFNSGTVTFENILADLLKGGIDENSVIVTIPEGMTMFQIAELLSSKNIVNKETFLKCAAELDPPYEYIENSKDYTKFEGFLFPATYAFPKSFTEKEVIAEMLNKFDKVWNDKYRTRAKELGFTAKEIITIASLIEREAKIDYERPIISSVIHNRLKIGMRLQIDATIQYILGKQKAKLLYSDLEIESPYNTYLHEGLTPTPIAAPGEACIKAALYPENTEYLYYRTKKSDNGEHFFSKTLEEHNSYDE
jgi:UPF0755 protein